MTVNFDLGLDSEAVERLKDSLKSKCDFRSECWLFDKTNQQGYACIHIAGRTHRASRVSYYLHFGPFNTALFVCHRCDTPACINPAHLFLGLQSDNMADAMKKGRMKCGRSIYLAHTL